MEALPKPVLLQPVFVPQPTWGGVYIAEKKGWTDLPSVAGKKIGQSYELYGKSNVFPDVSDTDDPQFLPNVLGVQNESSNTIAIQSIIDKNPVAMLGPDCARKFGRIPILIKFTQALGNSFQLHIKQDAKSEKWKPKAESWYYLEPGKLTFGIHPGYTVEEYKSVCKEIERMMIEESEKVRSGTHTLEEAKDLTQARIRKLNPWQFVNVHTSNKNELIDLSQGAIHHSWEEDSGENFLGNIVYEVQQDVTDDESTLRSFDQGKFLTDGSVRQITIDEYFRYIDTDPKHNDISYSRFTPKGDELIVTPYYSMEQYRLQTSRYFRMPNSFHHLFVREGKISVTTEGHELTVGAGHSVFIPSAVTEYELRPKSPDSTVLNTFIS